MSEAEYLREKIARLERELAAIDDAIARRPFRKDVWYRADMIRNMLDAHVPRVRLNRR